MPDTHFQPTYSIETHEADPRRPWFNLRRLLVLLVLLGAAPLLVNEFLSYQRQRLDRVESTRRSIDALAEVVADSSAQMARGVGRLLTALAASPVVLADDPPACARYLKRLLSLQPDFLNFGLIGLDGRVVCEATGIGGNVFLGDRDYFKRALEGDLLTVGAHQVGRITGRRFDRVCPPCGPGRRQGEGGAVRRDGPQGTVGKPARRGGGAWRGSAPGGCGGCRAGLDRRRGQPRQPAIDRYRAARRHPGTAHRARGGARW